MSMKCINNSDIRHVSKTLHHRDLRRHIEKGAKDTGSIAGSVHRGYVDHFTFSFPNLC